MNRILFVLAFALLVSAPSGAHADAQTHYDTLCASCHGAQRYGGEAPPLLPETLGRKKDDALAKTILEGRPNTQMPPFAAALSPEDAAALVALIRTPVTSITWGAEQIAASRKSLEPDGPPLPAKTNRPNLTLVVERGAGAIAVLDGDSMKELDRFPVGRIHGGPKFDEELRRIWAVTRDGTVSAYDLDAGGLRGTVKAAVNARNVAVNPDGSLVAVAAQLPEQIAVLDGALNPRAVLPLEGQPSGVYQVPGEAKFILTLRDNPKLMLIDQATMEVEVRELPEPFEDFVFVPGRRQLLASSRGGGRILLYDLDAGTVLATLETEALPHLFSACFFERDGKLHSALNHIGVPKLTIVTVDDLAVQKEIALAGSGYFARTHPGTPWIWVDTNTEQIELVDKVTLTRRVTPITPDPGKKAMHVEFTEDGSRALVSVWDPVGAVVVYDGTTADETGRMPYAMPIGKYNAHNKTPHFRERP